MERRVDTDTQKQVSTPQTTYQGKLSVSATVSILEDGREITPEEEVEARSEDLTETAENAAGADTGRGGDMAGNVGLRGSASAGAEYSITGRSVSSSATLSVVSVGSLMRSTATPAILVGASYGTEVLFSGGSARNHFQAYCRDKLGIAADNPTLALMTDEVRRHSENGETPSFTLHVEYSLRDGPLQRFQALEKEGRNKEAQAILDDTANYGEGTATLTIAGREHEAYNISVAGFNKSIAGQERHTASFTIPARAA